MNTPLHNDTIQYISVQLSCTCTSLRTHSCSHTISIRHKMHQLLEERSRMAGIGLQPSSIPIRLDQECLVWGSKSFAICNHLEVLLTCCLIAPDVGGSLRGDRRCKNSFLLASSSWLNVFVRSQSKITNLSIVSSEDSGKSLESVVSWRRTSARSGNDRQVDHAVFLPRPANPETVSSQCVHDFYYNIGPFSNF